VFRDVDSPHSIQIAVCREIATVSATGMLPLVTQKTIQRAIAKSIRAMSRIAKLPRAIFAAFLRLDDLFICQRKLFSFLDLYRIDTLVPDIVLLSMY
jgi:hypothetical protein